METEALGEVSIAEIQSVRVHNGLKWAEWEERGPYLSLIANQSAASQFVIPRAV